MSAVNRKIITIILIIVLLAIVICEYILSKSEEKLKDDDDYYFDAVKTEIEITDPEDASFDKLVEMAKKEGRIETVCMSDSMVNLDKVWDNFADEYGIEQTDVYLDTEDILVALSGKTAKSMATVNIDLAEKAAEQGILKSYKDSYWDSVPDWAKDKNGFWVIPYAGCTSFVYNNDIIKDPEPHSWEDIRAGSYKITVGDVTVNRTGQSAVIASAYAFGGNIDNLEPAFDFWLELAQNGRIDSGDILIPRVQSGEIECGVTLSYNAKVYRDCAENYSMSMSIPSDGAILTGKALIISMSTNTPFSAELAKEYILSDRGQIEIAKSGAIPVRTNISIPNDVAENTFSPTEYVNAIGIDDAEKYNEACETVANWWKEKIVPII